MYNERVIYGLTDDYHVVAYWILKNDPDPSIGHLRSMANRLQLAYPRVTKTWAVDNEPVVKHGYMSAKKGGLEDRVLFKVLLEEQGVGYSNRPGGDLQSLFPFIFTLEVRGCTHWNGGVSR